MPIQPFVSTTHSAQQDQSPRHQKQARQNATLHRCPSPDTTSHLTNPRNPRSEKSNTRNPDPQSPLSTPYLPRPRCNSLTLSVTSPSPPLATLRPVLHSSNDLQPSKLPGVQNCTVHRPASRARGAMSTGPSEVRVREELW